MASEEIKELFVNGENVLKPAEFKEIENELESLKEDLSLEEGFDSFETKRNWLGFPKPVTGEDMQHFVIQLQEKFENVHEMANNITKVIDTFLKSFGSLDKGYLQGILLAIKSGQEAHEQADIALTNLKKTLEVLERFKEKNEDNRERIEEIDEYINKSLKVINHLSDVDSIWKDVKELKDYRAKLKETKHFNEVDAIWERSIVNKKNIDAININQTNDHKSIEEITERLTEEIACADSRNSLIRKRLKIAYIFAGTSWIFSISVLILRMTGMI